MDFVVQLLRSQLAAQIEPDSTREKLIKLLHSIGLFQPDPFHQFDPFSVYIRRSVHRLA
jgi:hypothetical protein